VGGIFCGSMLWWIILVVIVNRLRDRFNEGAICWMNRMSAPFSSIAVAIA